MDYKQALDEARQNIEAIAKSLKKIDKRLCNLTPQEKDMVIKLLSDSPQKIICKGEINLDELSEEAKRQLSNIVFSSTPTPDLSLDSVKESWVHNVTIDWEKVQERMKEYEQEKPQLEIGKWYKSHPKALYCVSKIEGDKVYSYGFALMNGAWYDEVFCDKEVHLGDKPATDKEVEEALITEAKRRGYDKYPHKFMNEERPPCEGFTFTDKWLGEHYAIYDSRTKNIIWSSLEGKWAEIIEQPEGDTKLKKGKWYKYADIVALFQGRNSQTYGQHKGHGFLNKATLDWNFPWKPATENEVIEALSEQAKILGFKQGDEIYDINGDETNVSYHDARLIGANNNEFELGTAIVMRDGQWAEYRKVSDEVEKLELPLYDMRTEDLLDAQIAITRELLNRELK